MLDSHVSREQRIADMTVHGWIPVRDSERSLRRFTGIYHEALGVGFAHSPSCAGQQIVRLEFGSNPIPMWHECSWDDVTDVILDAIDARLTQL